MEPPQPLCKSCRKPFDPVELKRVDRESRPGVFERAYVCPRCHAVLEFAQWQTGSRRGRKP